MYTLTLTKEDRSAIDWVGYRYNHGDDFYKLLCRCKRVPDDLDWTDDVDLTFLVSESIAWDINELFRSDDYTFTCFSNDLASKLTEFCYAIV